MNSRQYAKMMEEAMTHALTESTIKPDEYTSVCLSADRTTYEVTLLDGTVKLVPSGFEYFED